MRHGKPTPRSVPEELVLAFEEQFDIDIPDEDTEKIRTVGDAVGYISARKKS